MAETSRLVFPSVRFFTVVCFLESCYRDLIKAVSILEVIHVSCHDDCVFDYSSQHGSKSKAMVGCNLMFISIAY